MKSVFTVHYIGVSVLLVHQSQKKRVLLVHRRTAYVIPIGDSCTEPECLGLKFEVRGCRMRCLDIKNKTNYKSYQ